MAEEKLRRQVLAKIAWMPVVQEKEVLGSNLRPMERKKNLAMLLLGVIPTTKGNDSKEYPLVNLLAKGESIKLCDTFSYSIPGKFLC